MNLDDQFERLVENERYFNGYRGFEECLEAWLRSIRAKPERLSELATTTAAWTGETQRRRAGYLLDFAAVQLGSALPGGLAPDSARPALPPVPLFWKHNAAQPAHDDLARRWGLTGGLDFGRFGG